MSNNGLSRLLYFLGEFQHREQLEMVNVMTMWHTWIFKYDQEPYSKQREILILGRDCVREVWPEYRWVKRDD